MAPPKKSSIPYIASALFFTLALTTTISIATAPTTAGVPTTPVLPTTPAVAPTVPTAPTPEVATAPTPPTQPTVPTPEVATAPTPPAQPTVSTPEVATAPTPPAQSTVPTPEVATAPTTQPTPPTVVPSVPTPGTLADAGNVPPHKGKHHKRHHKHVSHHLDEGSKSHQAPRMSFRYKGHNSRSATFNALKAFDCKKVQDMYRSNQTLLMENLELIILVQFAESGVDVQGMPENAREELAKAEIGALLRQMGRIEETKDYIGRVVETECGCKTITRIPSVGALCAISDHVRHDLFHEKDHLANIWLHTDKPVQLPKATT
jgi:hypothetical protein